MKKNAFTLVELVVTLFILSAILAATFATFITLSRSFKAETKTSETQIESVLGLEILRYDIEMAGYGLPHSTLGVSTCSTGSLPVAYSEALSSASYTDSSSYTPNKYTPDPTSFNDSTNSCEPRAVVLSNNGNTGGDATAGTFDDSDVLVIKSLVVSLSDVTRKYSIRYYDVATSSWKNRAWSSTTRDFVANDKVIVLSSGTDVTSSDRAMQQIGATFYANIDSWPVTTTLPNSGTLTDIFLIYGLETATTPRMPFNRVDYYLQRANTGFPGKCHPQSYTLYRGVIANDSTASGGKRTEQPIMDCVVDFQVGLNLDTGWVTTSGAVGSVTDLTTASNVRSKVKQVKVAVLTHEGQYDKDFSYANTTINLGDSTFSMKTYGLTNLTNYQNYKWKVLLIDVKTVNLL
ncbi:MAG: prepilin-type N-terminal cleavage/methylation domain-containing protein [Nitrospirae bacterium YQR-1]